MTPGQPELTARQLREARRRIENQREFFAAKASRAASPIERAAVAWDQWRAVVRELPGAQADQSAELLLATLTDQINHLARQSGDRP